MNRRQLTLIGCVAGVLLLAGAFAAAPIDGGDGATPTAMPTPGDTDGTATATSTDTASDETETDTATATPAETATPAGANGSEPAEADERLTNRTYDGLVIGALAEAGDGDVLLAGGTGLRASNATVFRVGADGDTEWTYEGVSANQTGISAVESAPDGGAYVLESEQYRPGNGSRPTLDLRLVRLDGEGEVRWRTSLNASDRATARGIAMAPADDGVVVAFQLAAEGGVRLAQFDDAGEIGFERTYDVAGTPTGVRTTADGYLLTGTVGFDDPWVLRTDASGDALFNRTYEDVQTERVVGAVPTDDGGAIVAGWQRAGRHGFNPTPWAAKLDAEGVPEWNRVYPTGGQTRVQDVVADGDGIVMTGVDRGGWATDAAARAIAVGPDGTERFQTRLGDVGRPTAVTVAGDRITVASAEFTRPRNVSSTVQSVRLPERVDGPGLQADVAVSSNETVYRGQNLLFDQSNATIATYDLVAIPGEYDEFDRHVERRIVVDGETVVESATLPEGEYVLETRDGEPLALENGTVRAADADENASFRVATHDLYRVEPNRTYVNAADGEGAVAVGLDSERSNYSVYVSADRFRGDAASAGALREAFDDTAGFAGVETVHGQPAARIEIGPAHEVETDDRRHRRSDRQFTVDASAFDAGLYELRVAGVDTADGGASATATLVVGNATADPLDVTLENESLTVPVGNETTTNVTLSGLSDGIAAMSMSANRSGDPAIGLGLDLDINASRASGSAGWSSRGATAGATAFDGDTPNGTVQVGALTVQARERSIDPNATATNTVAFELDWVVDERGVPYAIPDGQTVTVEVTDLENATGDSRASGSASASGSTSSSG